MAWRTAGGGPAEGRHHCQARSGPCPAGCQERGQPLLAREARGLHGHQAGPRRPVPSSVGPQQLSGVGSCKSTGKEWPRRTRHAARRERWRRRPKGAGEGNPPPQSVEHLVRRLGEGPTDDQAPLPEPHLQQGHFAGQHGQRRLAGEASSCWHRRRIQQGLKLGQQHHQALQGRRDVQGRGHRQPSAPEQAQSSFSRIGPATGLVAAEVIQPPAQSQHATVAKVQEP